MEPPAFQALEAIPERASVASCFGSPTSIGDRTVIPVAEVYFGLGLGWGGGSDASAHAEGGGGGGGGGMRSRAVAVIELSPSGVRVIPIRDQTAIILAAIAFASVATSLLARPLSKWRR